MLIIYVLIKGYLDDILVVDIICFEDELNYWVELNVIELLNEIREIGGLLDVEKFDIVINEFKKSFSKFE